MHFSRENLKQQLTDLAIQGVFIGTSSWKYPGWCGTLYDPARYEWRGKFAESRFNRNCLAEYAEVFKTVCVDAAYYTFPSQQYLEGLVNQTPDDFLFGFKVTDTITIKKFPNLDRFGDLAGKPNENFLDAELFVKAFLKPCESVRSNVGLLMFEFSRFWPTDYEHGRDFIADLDKFLGQLAQGLAVRRRDAEPELAEAGVFRVPRPAPGHPRVQLLGSHAAGERTDGSAGQQDKSRSDRRTIPPQTWKQVRGSGQNFSTLRLNQGRDSRSSRGREGPGSRRKSGRRKSADLYFRE